MKYKYLYQTKDNENREGWIDARDRADAYTRLRKQGIRPYRVIGNDPSRWRAWAPWAVFVPLALIGIVAVVVEFLFHSRSSVQTLNRCQLTGDPAVISSGMASNWEGVLTSKLDRYLAAYAQPGWIALPPEATDEEIAAFAEELDAPVDVPSAARPEVRLLCGIVAKMREEMRTYLAGGGSVKDYLDFLEDRQDQERDYRNKAIDAIARAPESMRERVRMNVNVRLREMGLTEIR